jgi:pyrrolysine biosynthesis protein PylC
VVVKPDVSSGSRGVRIVHTDIELKAILPKMPNAVVQAYADGPSFSIEMVGLNGRALPLVVTDIHLDPGFDCKRVTAPTILSAELVKELSLTAAKLAEALHLTGVMDLEAILSNGELKLLEIDARLPSQTPTTVYWSTGINIVELLGNIFVDGRLPEIKPPENPKIVVYEHVLAADGRLLVTGEHIMSDAGPLSMRKGFYGADEALTDYRSGLDTWRATMIYYGHNHDEVWSRRKEGLSALARDFSLSEILDLNPGEED